MRHRYKTEAIINGYYVPNVLLNRLMSLGLLVPTTSTRQPVSQDNKLQHLETTIFTCHF